VSRRLVRLVVTVLALGVILVAADLAARTWATGRIAAQVRQEYDLAQDPSVSVAGGSFLWQAARGRFEDVTVGIAELETDDVTLQDVRVRIPEVDVPLRVLTGGSGTVDVAAGTVRAQTSFAELAQVVSVAGLDVELTRADDAVRASTTVGVLGLGLDLAVTVRPELDGSTVAFAPVSAELAGAQIPLSRAESLLEAAGFGGWSIELDDVPDQVVLDALQVTDDGVVVTGTLTASAVDVG
jgi:hypothetical protein